jgi:hypothetical protein
MAPAARSERITGHVARLLRAERERSLTTQAPPVKAASSAPPEAQPNPFGAEPRHLLPRIHRPAKKVGTWKPARS